MSGTLSPSCDGFQLPTVHPRSRGSVRSCCWSRVECLSSHSGCCNDLPQTGWFQQQGFIFSQFWGWESEVRPSWAGSGETSLRGSQTLASPCVLTWREEREERARVSSSYTDIIPLWVLHPPSRPPLSLITSQRPHPQFSHSGS